MSSVIFALWSSIDHANIVITWRPNHTVAYNRYLSLHFVCVCADPPHVKLCVHDYDVRDVQIHGKLIHTTSVILT